jgi:MraZ protein
MSNSIQLIGSYEISLDSKGRFLLPKTYKDQLPEGHKEEFVLTIEFEKCLKLYPKVEFLKQSDVFNQYEQMDQDLDRLRRSFNRYADIVTIDAAGRINISNSLMEKVGMKINSKIKTISLGNAIEIWDLEINNQYEKEEDDLQTLKKTVVEKNVKTPKI